MKNKNIIKKLSGMKKHSDFGMWMEGIGYNQAIDDVIQVLEAEDGQGLLE